VRDDAKDAARYRFLRNTFFERGVDVPPDFTGDVIIGPPRCETYEHGISIMTNAAHSQTLDDAIDAAIDGNARTMYKLLKDAS
jgi:hypothetical protein